MHRLTNPHLPTLTRRHLLHAAGLSLVAGFLPTFRPSNVWAKPNDIRPDSQSITSDATPARRSRSAARWDRSTASSP